MAKNIGHLLIFLCLLGMPLDALAVPGKIFNDMTVTNQNSDIITSDVFWHNVGFINYAALGITDSASYLPNQTFTNTGDVNLVGQAQTFPYNITLLGNGNASIAVQNQGDFYVSLGPTDNSYLLKGINSQGNLVNSGNITLDVQRLGGIYLSVSTAIEAHGASLANSGNLRLDLDGGVNTTGSNALVWGRGISFFGNAVTDLTVQEVPPHTRG